MFLSGWLSTAIHVTNTSTDTASRAYLFTTAPGRRAGRANPGRSAVFCCVSVEKAICFVESDLPVLLNYFYIYCESNKTVSGVLRV